MIIQQFLNFFMYKKIHGVARERGKDIKYFRVMKRMAGSILFVVYLEGNLLGLDSDFKNVKLNLVLEVTETLVRWKRTFYLINNKKA